MVAAHALATVATAVVLAHADRLLWSLWRLLSYLLRLVWPTTGLVVVRRSAPTLNVDHAATLVSWLGWRATDPRGPPVRIRPLAG